MQQLPLSAAMYFCRLMGCRLPTAIEWDLGYQRCVDAGADGGWNLRDRTWAVEYEFANVLLGKGVIAERPQRGFFEALYDTDFLAQKPRVWAKSLRQPADTPDGRYDDGILWFRPVYADSPAPFKDLVGNVAEFVCNDMSLWQEIADKPPADLHKILERRKQTMALQPFVLGGSALSSPAKPFADRRPLNDVDARFADVGLRLAFTAAGKPASEKLRELAAKRPYRLSR
jgi:hypothetical protein